MMLEILRTNVILKANNHNHKPCCATIGGFAVEINKKYIQYDNYEYVGGIVIDEDSGAVLLDFSARGGSEIYYVDNELILDCEEYKIPFDVNVIDEFEITKIEEIYYEAFTNKDEGVEFEFYPIEFELELCERESNTYFKIKASKEVLKEYVELERDNGNLNLSNI